MFKWLKQRRINSLHREIAYDRAFLKALDECNETCAYHAARLAENEEKLRQLGWISEAEIQERAARQQRLSCMQREFASRLQEQESKNG